MSGVLAVTIIDSLGSITSRKWNYNYTYPSPISFLVYTSLGYFGCKYLSNLTWALIIPAIVGIYDSTVGRKISAVFNANFGKYREGNESLSLKNRVLSMIGVSALFAFIGYSLAGWNAG